MRRAPYGARGLKSLLSWGVFLVLRRAPYGARGLKSDAVNITPDTELESRPVWGAWIEMVLFIWLTFLIKSRPVWGAWIEIYTVPF